MTIWDQKSYIDPYSFLITHNSTSFHVSVFCNDKISIIEDDGKHCYILFLIIMINPHNLI